MCLQGCIQQKCRVWLCHITLGVNLLQIKMVDDDMTVVCTIIATAEYCSEVVSSLGRSIAKTLESPYNEQVHNLVANLYRTFTWNKACFIRRVCSRTSYTDATS